MKNTYLILIQIICFNFVYAQRQDDLEFFYSPCNERTGRVNALSDPLYTYGARQRFRNEHVASDFGARDRPAVARDPKAPYDWHNGVDWGVLVGDADLGYAFYALQPNTNVEWIRNFGGYKVLATINGDRRFGFGHIFSGIFAPRSGEYQRIGNFILTVLTDKPQFPVIIHLGATSVIPTSIATTSGSTLINVGAANTSRFLVGMVVSGVGIPSGTTVTAVNTTTGAVTLSNAATATSTGVTLTTSTPVTAISQEDGSVELPSSIPLPVGITNRTITSNRLIASVNQPICGIGNSKNSNGHIHMYSFNEAPNLPVNISSYGFQKDPLQWVQHDTANYSVYVNEVRDANKALNFKVKVVAEMRDNAWGALRAGANYSAAVMDIDEVQLKYKRQDEADSRYRLFQGENFESRICDGSKDNTIRYPSVGNPLANYDIETNTIATRGSWNRTGVDPDAYCDFAPYNALDNYYFVDIYPKIATSNAQRDGRISFARNNREARMPDGKYVLKPFLRTSRNAYFYSNGNTRNLEVDNFLPYIENVIVQSNATKTQYRYKCQYAADGNLRKETSDDVGYDYDNPLPNSNYMRIWASFSEEMKNVTDTTVRLEIPLLGLNVDMIKHQNDATRFYYDIQNFDALCTQNNIVKNSKVFMTFKGKDLAGNDLVSFSETQLASGVVVPSRNEKGDWLPTPAADRAEKKHYIPIACDLTKNICAMADFTFTVNGLTASFNGSSSPNSPIYTWTFGLGLGSNSSTLRPSFTFPRAGEYPVTLAVTYQSGPYVTLGNTIYVTKTVTVTECSSPDLGADVTNEVTYYRPGRPGRPGISFVIPGSISIISGIPSNATFQWSNGATTSNIENLKVGQYALTLTEEGGCKSFYSWSLGGFECSGAMAVDAQVYSSMGGENGIINLTTQSAGNLSYQWANAAGASLGITTPYALDLTPGMYKVTITSWDDLNNVCGSTVRTYTVVDMSMTSEVKNTCANTANGAIYNTTTENMGSEQGVSWTYSWYKNGRLMNNLSTKEVSNLEAGTYERHARRTLILGGVKRQATLISTFAISTFPAMQYIVSKTNPCKKIPSTAVVIQHNQVEALSYEWSNGDYLGHTSELEAGDHFVTITDVNYCQYVGSVTVGAPLTLSVSITNACTVTGGADVQASGGVPPYKFYWDTWGSPMTNISSSGNTSRLSAPRGRYVVSVTDAEQNCTVFTEVQISRIPTSFTPTFVTTNTSSYCKSDGQVSINLPLDGMPYSIGIRGPGIFRSLTPISNNTATFRNLLEGGYIVFAQNRCGVNSSQNLVINTDKPKKLAISVNQKALASCEGKTPQLDITKSNPALAETVLTINNGYPPFNITIPGIGTFTMNAIGRKTFYLPIGNWTFNITDATNCDPETSSIQVTGKGYERWVIDCPNTDKYCDGRFIQNYKDPYYTWAIDQVNCQARRDCGSASFGNRYGFTPVTGSINYKQENPLNYNRNIGNWWLGQNDIYEGTARNPYTYPSCTQVKTCSIPAPFYEPIGGLPYNTSTLVQTYTNNHVLIRLDDAVHCDARKIMGCTTACDDDGDLYEIRCANSGFVVGRYCKFSIPMPRPFLVGNERAENSGIYLYPNPVIDDFTVNIPLALMDKLDYSVKLYNELGQNIEVQTIEQEDNNAFMQINCQSRNQLSKGVYYLHIISKGKSYVLKVVSY